MNTSQNHLTLSKARSAFRLRPVGQGSDRALFRHSLIPFVSTLLAAPWALAEEPVVLPEVIVTAKPQYPSDAGYKAHRTTTATKTDTPIFDLPVSIQVVPEVVIDDQQAVDLKDILRNVSGVYSANLGGSSRFETFSVRGFEQTFIYRDGVRLPRFFGPRDTSNLDRIEVLKGPAAVLYGRIEPGGLINMVPKQPLPEARYSLEQEAGSFDFYRTLYSATGSLFGNRAAPEASATPGVHPKDIGLYYRVDGAYTNANWFREFPDPFDGQSQDFERIFVSPRLKWEIDARTHAEIFLEYLDDARPFDRGLIALNGTARGLPIDFRLDDVHSNVEVEQFRGGIRWSHDLNEDWRLSNSFVGNFALDEDLRIQNRALQADRRTLQRQVRRRESEYEIYTTSLDLTGHFDVLGTKHNVLLGGDYYYDSELLLFAIGPDFPSIDIFRPVFGLPLPPIDPIEQVATTNTITKNEWYGIYFQDQIDILSNLHILGGGRYDWLSSQIDNRLTSLTTITDEGVFSPRVEIVYQPWPWLSLYGNFIESVGLGGEGISASGKPFEPEFATQYEAGLKAEWFGGELSTTLAFYRLTKENILNPDPAHLGFSVQIGKARSQGIEIDMVGQLTAEWNVIASYAYTGLSITKPAFFSDARTEQDQIGLYVQEQAKLYDKWVIALGGRQDFVSSDTNNIVAGTSQDSDASKFSGRAGLVYLADNGLAPYFSYTQSFLPVVGTDSSGGILQPETGEQYGIGVKYQPSGVDSFITASAFDLTRQNVVSINPATFASVQTGEQRSRGFELEAVGSFLDSALNITAAYTYQDVEITKSIAGDEGNRPLGVPEQLAAIYAEYTVPGGALRGLGFGLGVTYQGSISGGSLDGDPANTFEVDGFTLVDAAVHYDWRKLRFAVNVQNLFDNEHIDQCFDAGICLLAPTKPWWVLCATALIKPEMAVGNSPK